MSWEGSTSQEFAYYKLETALEQKARQLIREAPTRRPTTEPALILTLSRQCNELKDFCQDTSRQIALLEPFIGVSELRGNLKLAEKSVAELEEAVALSRQFLDLQQEILREHRRIMQHIQQALTALKQPDSLAGMELGLETLLDASAGFSEQIEAWAERQFPVAPLQDAWQRLNRDIERLCDILDDLAEAA